MTLNTRLARSDTVSRIVRAVVASHEELAPHGDVLSADFIAATPPSGKYPKGGEGDNG
ncbi:hypothetical protein [Streptomyces albipurpureus]|uniref:Uncharacterized protein n=1 Tax=Streptomyces albipurpureus TaxID=2897419 RepID=A0ABT0V038_9ACTN|nr:hypothetical protein [Streptomyces sp. CWNU-1]MCM2394198.1 hypothetical protein [Streptomyces sp. CWNU-1]